MDPEGYESLDGRLKAIKIAFALMAVVALTACIFDYVEVSLMDRLIAGETVSDAELSADDTRQGIIGVLQLAVYIACIVTFLRWMSRAYKNLDAVAPTQRRYGTGWAIGGWFVPILNLWRPKEIINDIWRSGGTTPGALLAIWWGGIVINGWLGSLAARSIGGNDTPQNFRESALAYMVSDGLDVPLAILAIVVAVKTTRQLEVPLDYRRSAPEPEQQRFERAEELPENTRAEDGTFPSYPG
jgi:hypothetical protein